MCASVLVQCSIHTPERAWKPSPWALCLPSMYTSMPALERPYTAPTPTLRFPQTGLSPHYYVTDIIHTFINGMTQWAKLQGKQRGEGGYVLQFAQCPKVEKLLCCCCGLYIEREYQGLSLSGLFVQPRPALHDLMSARISNSVRQVMSTHKLLILDQLNRKCIHLERFYPFSPLFWWIQRGVFFIILIHNLFYTYPVLWCTIQSFSAQAVCINICTAQPQ